MKKIEVVKKKEEFNDIIQNSKFIKNDLYTIYIRKAVYSYSRFGLAISKKVGNAVVRNKLKRQIRNIIDNNKDFFSKTKDYIIMIKKSCTTKKYQEMNDALVQLIKEIK